MTRCCGWQGVRGRKPATIRQGVGCGGGERRGGAGEGSVPGSSQGSGRDAQRATFSHDPSSCSLAPCPSVPLDAAQVSEPSTCLLLPACHGLSSLHTRCRDATCHAESRGPHRRLFARMTRRLADSSSQYGVQPRSRSGDVGMRRWRRRTAQRECCIASGCGGCHAWLWPVFLDHGLMAAMALQPQLVDVLWYAASAVGDGNGRAAVCESSQSNPPNRCRCRQTNACRAANFPAQYCGPCCSCPAPVPSGPSVGLCATEPAPLSPQLPPRTPHPPRRRPPPIPRACAISPLPFCAPLWTILPDPDIGIKKKETTQHLHFTRFPRFGMQGEQRWAQHSDWARDGMSSDGNSYENKHGSTRHPPCVLPATRLGQQLARQVPF